MRLQAESGQKFLGFTADFKDAHRLVAIREEDWPLLGCNVAPGEGEDELVYLNTRGTFGIASAAYWST